MSTRESAAVERRLAELGNVEIVRRTDTAAIVRVDGVCILLDGRRLAADPKHTGLRLLGPDLTLRAEHAVESPTLSADRHGVPVVGRPRSAAGRLMPKRGAKAMRRYMRKVRKALERNPPSNTRRERNHHG